mmetsp:Transcript_5020/g.7450  ORF Transcript_5020/g.7450 Transcript_5020/m.7450 type:complete len:779 (+) Transcript_5020:23-2359(+)
MEKEDMDNTIDIINSDSEEGEDSAQKSDIDSDIEEEENNGNQLFHLTKKQKKQDEKIIDEIEEEFPLNGLGKNEDVDSDSLETPNEDKSDLDIDSETLDTESTSKSFTVDDLSILQVGDPILTFDNSGIIRYDDRSKRIIRIKNDLITIYPLNGEPKISLKNSMSVDNESRHALDAVLNPNRTAIAITVTHSLIVIIDMTTGAVKSVSAKESKFKSVSTKILSIVWITNDTILILSTTSIELAKMTPSTNPLNTMQVTHTIIDFCKYDAENNILLVSPPINMSQLIKYRKNGKPYKHYFQAWLVKPKTMERLDKIPVFLSNSNPQIREKEVYLTTLYRVPTIIYICTEIQEFKLFYSKSKHTYFDRVRAFNLYAEGEFSCSFIDNLIVIHNHHSNLSRIYDHYFRHDQPISPPLPIKCSAKDPSIVSLYSKNWEYCSDRFIIDHEKGHVYTLSCNFSSRVISIRNKELRLNFFLGRTKPFDEESRLIILDEIRDWILYDDIDMRTLSKLFLLLNRHCKMIDDIKSKGHQVKYPYITPHDVYEHIFCVVFSRLSSDSSNSEKMQVVSSSPWSKGPDEPLMVSSRKLLIIVLRYIFIRLKHSMRVSHEYFLFLLEILVLNEDFALLHQLIQYKVIGDSLPIATHLRRLGEGVYPPAYQLSIDMLFRLEKYVEICEMYMEVGEVMKAIRLMLKHGKYFIAPASIFEVVVQLQNELLFYEAYQALRYLNYQTHPEHGRSFLPEDKCEAYNELFQTIFSSAVRGDDIDDEDSTLCDTSQLIDT